MFMQRRSRKPRYPVTGKWTDSGLLISETLLKIKVSSVNFKMNALSEYKMEQKQIARYPQG